MLAVGLSYIAFIMLILCLVNFHVEYILGNAGLDESQAGIKIAGGNISNFR